MDRQPADDRSAISLAWGWASRIIVVAATMVAPALAGVWIDKKLGTVVVFFLIGFAIGITGAIVQLMGIVRESSAKNSKRATPDNKK